MIRKRRLIVSGVVLALLAALILLTPAKLQGPGSAPALSEDLDAYLLAAENASPYPLIQGAEKRIRWQQAGERTPYAIVYLHGFSATRRELSPSIEMVADSLGANLFETRLAGHGRASSALEGTVAEQWLDDAAEALAIGSQLGDKIILIGTSTGGTLAVAMLGHPLMANVSDIVLISPNFALQDGKATLLTMPAGPQLADWLIGPTRSFETRSELHARYWSSTYPTRAVVEMMRLLNYANANAPASVDANLLVILSQNDQVVSPVATRAFFDRTRAPKKHLIDVVGSDDPLNHVLAGDIMSPSTSQQVADDIVLFIRGTGDPANVENGQ